MSGGNDKLDGNVKAHACAGSWPISPEFQERLVRDVLAEVARQREAEQTQAAGKWRAEGGLVHAAIRCLQRLLIRPERGKRRQ